MFSAWLRLSVSHHDFIFGEPLDPVGDHPWNSELALCNLFRTFPRLIDEWKLDQPRRLAEPEPPIKGLVLRFAGLWVVLAMPEFLPWVFR
jgi:hypothetical protein